MAKIPGAGSSKLRSRWWVYMLRCADGTLYTGITCDLVRRLLQHNAGTASKYTRSRRPVELAYRKSLSDRSAALRREAAIKRLTRIDKELLIEGRRGSRKKNSRG